jgi:hypothetical protein
MMSVTSNGFATGLQDTSTHLEIHAAKLLARIPVVIKNKKKSEPISFRREFMPVLSAAGCASIGCHGAPSGKNGFRLSLWGFDPDLDHRQLTHDELGRRTNSLNADNSLILLKAFQHIPHVGGRRFSTHSLFANLVRTWQLEGRHDDTQPVGLTSLEITPSRRVLSAPAKWQQLSVRATFDDGHSEDVTRLTTFSSSDLAVATVDRTGLVEFNRQGEVAILCRFVGRMESVRLAHIATPPEGYLWPNPAENNYVDSHVFSKLKMLNIAPSKLCSDEQFVRRVYLDLCGVLPTRAESQAFLRAAEPDNPNARCSLNLH